MAQRRKQEINVYNYGHGGINYNDKLEDIDVRSARNMVIDKNARLSTRLGYIEHSTVPDTTLSIDDMEATTGWSLTGDLATLTLDTTNQLRGSGDLLFNLSAYSTGTGKLTKSTISKDITLVKGHIGLRTKAPTGYEVDLTSIKFRFGSDSSNYYEWTLTAQSGGSQAMHRLNYSDATVTGTPVDATMTFAEYEFTTAAGYTGYTGYTVSDIVSYSSTTTSPVTSLFSFENSDTEVNELICTASTNMYLYDEASDVWEVIDTGLTEFETGSTTKRTRWSFDVYRNRLYGVNGYDTYKEWTGVKMNTYSGVEGRYIKYFKKRMYLAGKDSSPSTINHSDVQDFTTTYPTTLSNFFFGGEPSAGGVNAMYPIQDAIVVLKDDEVFSFYYDPTAGIVQSKIDTQGGGYAQRSLSFVNNDLFYLSNNGIRSLAPRGGVSGSLGLSSEALTSKLREVLDTILPKHRNSCIGVFDKNTNNYYFSFNANGGDIPDTTIVYSTKVGKMWTEATYPVVYDYTKWTTTEGSETYLMGNGNSGIIYTINSGNTDDGVAIQFETASNEYDFGEISQLNMAESVDFIGRKALGTIIDVSVTIDGIVVQADTITDEDMLDTPEYSTIGNVVIGLNPVGGSVTSDKIQTFKYIKRLPLAHVGQELSFKASSDSSYDVWTLDRAKIVAEGEETDLFPTINIG